jgi:hypothetical protein
MAAQIGPPDAAVRAHQEVFAYWASLKAGEAPPTRHAVHPEGLKRLLPTVSLIDVPRAPDTDYRVRLAGTGLYSVYGCEITGRTLSEVYNTAAADYWRAELAPVVKERRPAVGIHNLGWRGASHMSLVWIRLPLSADGERVDMILGYDAVVGSSMIASGIRAA